MKKFISLICGLFLVLSLSGCFSTISSNQDIVNGVMSLYDDYNVEILDSSDDCLIFKIEKEKEGD
jgi:hypothetical protein